MADDNWKKRIGMEINYSSDDEDAVGKHEQPLLSPEVDNLLMDFDHLSRTPPRTKMRIKDKSRRDKDTSSKSSPRVIYSGRSSSERNMFSRNALENIVDEGDGVVEVRRPSISKRSKQMLRCSERDLKLDLSEVHHHSALPAILREERAESLPPASAFKILGLQVESCNRFMSLSSKPICTRISRPQHPASATTEECGQSRVDFYQTFSMLIKMGNPERQGDLVNCRRQMSREEHLWQNELKDLIWLELQAWHADRTPQEQDAFLCEARESVQPLLQEIINYRFQKKSDPTLSNDSGIHIPLGDTSQVNGGGVEENVDEDDFCSCVSMFCPPCMEQQNNALREVEALMTRLQAAEALFPSSKAFAAHYPQYIDEAFMSRVKAMCVWYNMTKHHRLKLLILARHLLGHAEKDQPDTAEVLNELSNMINRKLELTREPQSNNCARNEANDFYDTQPLMKAARYLEQFDNSPNPAVGSQSCVYRKYIEDVLKTKGLRKALNFLERLHVTMLRKASLTLQQPDINNADKGVAESFEDEELRKYGYWSKDSQALGLPSYRAAYLFISHIPLDTIHAFLRLRLETKPERPSAMSIRQLIREVKEGLRLAVLNRQRYLVNVKTSLWNCSADVVEKFKYRVTYFDTSVQSVLQVYLDYLQQWVQMIEQQRVQKNILKDEWSFISDVTKHIPDGPALVSSSFCRMASSMFKINREQFKCQVDKLTQSIAHVDNTESTFKLTMFTVCRQLQEVCVNARENILNVLTLAKMLRKDLESEASESNRSAQDCDVIKDALSELKKETLSMCECVAQTVQQVDESGKVPEDWEECDKDLLQSRLREVLHQFFKFGFEYHKEICCLVTGGCRVQLARGLISFAQLWMNFVKSRCERGRGLRPRWANHGLDFIMTVCEPHFTSCLSDDEFEELKANIDDCISHVIGTVGVNGNSSPSASVFRGRGVSPSPSATRTPRPSQSEKLSTPELTTTTPELMCEATSSNEDKDGVVVETLICPTRRLSRRERLLLSVQQLDRELEERLRSESLIGEVVAVKTSESEQTIVRPRPVTFGWQRGIKIGSLAPSSASRENQFQCLYSQQVASLLPEQASVVGQGRFGKVYTAVNNETGELMAMKELALQPNDYRTIRSVSQELRIFEGIHHENLVRYYGIEIHREEMLIFMELCTEGTLESLVAATETGLPEVLVRRYTLQLTSAISTLHQHAIVHRDIKSANIFLTAEGNCLKLGDFGSAVKIKAHTTVPGELQGFVGTQAYMAPEVFMKTSSDGHGRAVDVWSLGCVLVEMASGKRPWAEYDSNYQIMFKVGMGETPQIPASLSDEGRHFARRCLVHDPSERAKTMELLSHTFLAVEGDDECISCSMPSILEDYLKLGIKR